MFEGKTVDAILLAAGSGTRFGSEFNKAFADLGGRPLYMWAAKTLASHPAIDRLILVIRPGDSVHFSSLALSIPHRTVFGGATRRESVLNAVSVSEADIVLIQDCARPFIKKEYIDGCLCAIRSCSGATVAALSADTIKISDNCNYVSETTDRARTWLTQTPQCFIRKVLIRANEAYDGSFEATDDCMLLEHMGEPVAIVPGARENIKITTPSDLLFAKTLTKS